MDAYTVSDSFVGATDLLINLLGLVVALGACCFAYYTYIKQKRTTITLDLSNRFQSWKLAMLADCDFDNKDKAKKYIQLYFDLCSEEFKLHSDCWFTNKIDATSWKYFKEGIENEVGQSPLYKEVWQELLDRKYYTNETFVDYMNQITNKKSIE